MIFPIIFVDDGNSIQQKNQSSAGTHHEIHPSIIVGWVNLTCLKHQQQPGTPAYTPINHCLVCKFYLY